MPTSGDGVKGAFPSLMVILGVALAAPIVLAAVSRPLAKTLIKGYLALADTDKEFAAEAGEHVSDLLAECKSEYASETSAAAKASKGKK